MQKIAILTLIFTIFSSVAFAEKKSNIPFSAQKVIKNIDRFLDMKDSMGQRSLEKVLNINFRKLATQVKKANTDGNKKLALELDKELSSRQYKLLYLYSPDRVQIHLPEDFAASSD